MEQKNTNNIVKLYGARDLFGAAAHFVCSATLVCASAAFVDLRVFAASAVLSLAMAVITKKSDSSFFENAFVEHKRDISYAPLVHQSVRDLTRKIGITRDMPLYDVVLKSSREKSGWNDAYDTEEMQGMVHAFAVNAGRPVLMMSDAALRVLTDSEKHAVLAHEVAHLGAHHSKLNLLNSTLLNTAVFATKLTAWEAFLETGWEPVLSGVLASCVVVAIRRHGEDWSVSDKELQASRDTLAHYTMWGWVAAIDPSVVLPFITHKAFKLGQSLIESSYSRRMEFQADRGTVRLGADPLDLIASLQKIETANARYSPKLYASHRSIPARLCEGLRQIFASLPATSRRVARLAQMPRQ